MSQPPHAQNPYTNQPPGQYPGQYPVPYQGPYPGPHPGYGAGDPRETPLHLPAYGVGLGTAVKRAWRKYVVFSGRASLSEYWWMVFFTNIVPFALLCFFMALSVTFDDPVTGEVSGWTVFAFLLWLGFGLAMLIPMLSVTARRLHDANYSGALLFLHLVPGIGSLVVAILCLFPSSPAGARFDTGFHPGPGGYPQFPGQGF